RSMRSSGMGSSAARRHDSEISSAGSPHKRRLNIGNLPGGCAKDNIRRGLQKVFIEPAGSSNYFADYTIVRQNSRGPQAVVYIRLKTGVLSPQRAPPCHVRKSQKAQVGCARKPKGLSTCRVRASDRSPIIRAKRNARLRLVMRSAIAARHERGP